MHAEIEQSGMHIRDGLIAIRIAMYLDVGDPRHDECHVYTIDTSSPEYKAGYKGEMKDGQPVDMDDFKEWTDCLPHIWQDNPFHNHFDMVSADITDSELKALIEKRLTDFGAAWSAGHASEERGEAIRQITLGWDRNDKHNKTVASDERCYIKGLDIAERKNNFKKIK